LSVKDSGKTGQKEAPAISELETQYDDLGVVMVGIDGENNPDKVREFVERYDIESPAVYKPNLGSEYGVSGYPTIYVLDGKTRWSGPTRARPRGGSTRLGSGRPSRVKETPCR
jgi:hypothetical protein